MTLGLRRAVDEAVIGKAMVGLNVARDGVANVRAVVDVRMALVVSRSGFLNETGQREPGTVINVASTSTSIIVARMPELLLRRR